MSQRSVTESHSRAEATPSSWFPGWVAWDMLFGLPNISFSTCEIRTVMPPCQRCARQ